VLLPACILGGTCFCRGFSLAVESTRFASSRCETAHFAMLVGWIANPIDTSIITDGGMEGIDHDDFIPFVHRILCYPVRVQDTEAATLTPYTLFRDGFQVTRRLLLVDACVVGFTIHDALAHLLLTPTTFDTHAINNVTLLGLVTETSCLVRSRCSCTTVNCLKG